MNRFLFFSSKFLPALLIAFVAITSASGQVVLSESAPPTTDLLVSLLTGGIPSNVFSEATSTDHARGQLFPLGDGPGDGFEITAITIRKGSTQTFDNDILTVRVFEGTGAQFDTGTGHTTASNGSDFFAGTTVTPIYTETFTIDGEFADDTYVTFNFANPVQVSESSNFGFLLTYEPGAGVLDQFQYLESTAGGRVAVRYAAHRISNRAFHHAVHGRIFYSNLLLGDVNLDDVVDFFDISPFVSVLFGGGFQVEADCDRNGVVNFLDISPFITSLSGS